ncbi:MAG: AAA family ATPase [Firmicutes bacterium]|nr:AAA family ATPase [Bacillota bacterium]
MGATAATDIGIQGVAREWLKDQVENHGIQVSEVARKLGYSRPAISQFLHGRKDSEQIGVAVLALRDRIMATPKEETPPVQERLLRSMKTSVDWVWTEDARRVIGVCEACQAEKAIGVVIGHSGAGKTSALKQFCDTHQDIIYISADVTMTAKSLVEEIAAAVGVEQSGSLRPMLRRIVARLQQDPKMIIIDEADILVSYTVRKMEILRALHDQAHIAIVLVGMPRLKALLVKGPSLKENLAQLYSRVGYIRELRGLSRDEAATILADYPLTDGARDLLVTVATNHAQGGMRRLTTLLSRSLAVAQAKGGYVTRDMVEAADGLTLR